MKKLIVSILILSYAGAALSFMPNAARVISKNSKSTSVKPAPAPAAAAAAPATR